MAEQPGDATRSRPIGSIVDSDWTVRELVEPQEILAILEADPGYAFYAIGDLDPRLAQQSRWGAAFAGDRVGLALHYAGLEPPALFLFGEPQGVALVLASVLRPEHALAIYLTAHRPVLAAFYHLGLEEEMLRMIWRPQAPPAGLGHPVLRLESRDITDLQDFYRMREGSVFGPAQLSAGVYYGVRQNGRLVSAAGTHLVSQAYRLAAIGNVFTLPEHCGRGLATACTAAVLVELAAGGYEIALNVGTSNGAAIHIYSRLGFVEHCRFVEAAVTRKGAKGTSQRL